MNDQERQVITGIFQRLEQAASQPRDPETERFIADKMRSQPYAPYAMAQLIYVQEEAIKSLNQQLEELRAKAASAGSSGGSFLSSIFGGGSRSEPQQPAQPQRQGPSPWGQAGQGPGYAHPQGGASPQGGYPQGGYPQGGYPQGGPWGGQPGMGQPGMMQGRGGSGFLGSALTTAAGVAGGMVVGNALMNAFGGGGHHALGGFDSNAMSSLTGAGAGAGDLFGGGSPDADLGSALGGGSDFQDASFDPGVDFGGGDAGTDFGGGDFGGDVGGDSGGDWT